MEFGDSTSACGPPPIPLIKSRNDDKSGKYFVKIKLRRGPTSEKLDLYEFKMALFDNGEPDDILLFIFNFNLTLEASVMLKNVTKIKYPCTLVRG